MTAHETSMRQEAGQQGNDTAPDILVIGGGPAGSTVSALPAGQGYDVVILEKSRHPRFHTGESLLPLNLPLFERLGVAEQVAAIGILKYGAKFILPDHDHASYFDFGQAPDKSFPHSCGVRRPGLDEILFKNAVAKGVRAREGCKVTMAKFPRGQRAMVTSRSENGQITGWHPRFVVGASGRGTLLANPFGIKQRNRKRASAAIFAHFGGAERRTGRDERNISLFWFERGWFWYIPLADGPVSVGAVCWPYYMKARKVRVEQFFSGAIALCLPPAERLKTAKLAPPVSATGIFPMLQAGARDQTASCRAAPSPLSTRCFLPVLTGDLSGDTPIRFRLAIFKFIYYLRSIAMFKESYRAWLRRKRAIREVIGDLAAP